MSEIISVDAIEQISGEFETQISQDFYVVSANKFITLFICTFGLYAIYWFYKNWALQKVQENESTIPFLRGIFYIFFTHALFNRVDKKLQREQKQFDWDSDALATWVIVLTILGRIIDRFAGKNMGSPYTDIIALLLGIVVGGLLFRAQMAINTACNDPKGDSNKKLTAANIVWVVIGSVFILLCLIGLFFMSNETQTL